MSLSHDTVLLKDAVDCLNIKPEGVYLDCTGGYGGHSLEIVKRLSPTGKLWICDYHMETVNRLKTLFVDDERVHVIYSRFSQIFDNLDFSFQPELNQRLLTDGVQGFDGILADFGISSPQLEDPQLGIGFSGENTFLDMRLDKNLTTTAADILKSTDEKQLADIFYLYGGERASRRISRAIVHDRQKGILYQHTHELRDLCDRVLGKFYRQKKIHPATKVFQALRIAVNHELDEVKTLLEEAPKRLNQGGRFVVISFHSGEDTLVKNKFRDLDDREYFFRPIKKAIKPTQEELHNNPRARSARMRVLERRL